jgi:hypothetical protein
LGDHEACVYSEPDRPAADETSKSLISMPLSATCVGADGRRFASSRPFCLALTRVRDQIVIANNEL